MGPLESSKVAHIKFVDDRWTSEAAGRRMLEYALAVQRPQNCVHVEKVNGPLLLKDLAKPADYTAGMKWLIDDGYRDGPGGLGLLLHPDGQGKTGGLRGA